jgi:hypothetical protein
MYAGSAGGGGGGGGAHGLNDGGGGGGGCGAEFCNACCRACSSLTPGGINWVAYRGSGDCTGRSTAEPIDLLIGHGRREIELPTLRHGRLSFVEGACDEVAAVVLGFLVLVASSSSSSSSCGGAGECRVRRRCDGLCANGKSRSPRKSTTLLGSSSVSRQVCQL